MKSILILLRLSLIIGTSFIFSSCQKFLDLKPDKSLAVPETIDDLQALLDDGRLMNQNYPAAGDIASDYYYLEYPDWNSLYFVDTRYTYVWNANAQNDQDWANNYQRIFTLNVVLDQLSEATGETVDRNKEHIRGSALFLRAYTLYHLTQLFAPAYDPADAKSTPGIPLRLTSDINDKTIRSTLQQTYDRIISDLKEAAHLLPVASSYKTRPTRQAAYGALAKVYLSMRAYRDAGKYADSCLALGRTLMDYNMLDTAAASPIELFNDEVIFHASMLGNSGAISPNIARVDSALYTLYEDNDLRKFILYGRDRNSHIAFKGDYGGQHSTALFSGIATDEIYLILAECKARNGNVEEAMDDLNVLLETRYKEGTFKGFQATGKTEALDLILKERRKELAFRGGIRWTDLRRLNKEPRYAVTLQRVLNGEVYKLPPGDVRYTFLIPVSVIEQSGIQQNQR